MTMIELMIQSKFKYTPSHDEWCEFWISLKNDDLAVNDLFVNDIFGVWHTGATPSPRQIYFMFKRIFPEAKLGQPPPKKNAPSLSNFHV